MASRKNPAHPRYRFRPGISPVFRLALRVILVGTAGGFWGCIPNLTRSEYRPEVNAYVFYHDRASSWRDAVIPRLPGKKKIQSDSTSRAVLETIQKDPILIQKYRFDLVWQDVPEGVKFSSGKMYYRGIAYLAEQKDSLAQREFEKALVLNPHLRYFSDIYFLLGQSFLNQNKTEAARYAFRFFLEYSECIHYPGFYQGIDYPEDGSELFARARAYLDTTGSPQADHRILLHSPGEVVKVKRQPNLPGYTIGKTPSDWKLTWSGGYSNDRVFGVVGLRYPITNRLDFFTSSAFGIGKKFSWYYLAFPYNVYLSDDNRFSVAVVTHFSFFRLNEINLLKRLIGLNLSTTYLWTPDLAVYSTYYIPYNTSEVDNNGEYFSSSYNQTYSQVGAAYYLYNRRPFSFGVFGEFVRGELRVGLSLFGKVGYNLERKEIFVDVYNVFF